MSFAGYHLGSAKWSYPAIVSIGHFLEDFSSELTIENLNENLETLKSYRDRLGDDKITLIFKNCELAVKGIDEVVNTIYGLEYALDQLQKISQKKK
ncbi:MULTISPECIES: hypothetical protein [Sporosarcina]|uniref:Uncharacterized protein n=1 Tax=Sporosarcina newyorkensis TaxID=759851 RepID=A0A1T4YR55_9BACL|nr:hypothetical protein [Sporosarcina newyorkensis]SKB03755.1 hypothetical protein SAMN04244570_3266 [Sporosarcina newyorkensis]